MTIASLQFVDEEDIPAIVRTLLKTMGKNNGGDVVKAIRKQCSSISMDTLIVVCDVLSTTFSVNPIAGKSFLNIFELI